MDEDIAYCGLDCSKCDAYIATMTDNIQMREELAKKWSKEYDTEIGPDELLCVGCSKTDGRHIDYWSECKIRECCEEKGLENCAHCDGYACDELESFFDMAMGTRERLDEIKKNLK